MLKLLHTADWHLGRRFPAFDEDAQRKLSRARLEIVSTIFDVARRNAVNAVLCAGDLFDDPDPIQDFWEALAKIFKSQPAMHPPTFLV
ncbi:MAG: metallophosphoesterase family protein, partial [Vicinamibacterales bacterium]